MYINDVLDQGSLIPRNNNFYNSDPWYLNTVNVLDKLLKQTQGRREIYDYMIRYNTQKRQDPALTLPDLLDSVDAVLMMNSYKYRHLWDIYEYEYNPGWNVDGTEITTRTRDNTGTQTNALSGTDTLTKSGSEANARSGYDSITQTGSIKEQNGGNITHSKTTYDSATFLDAEKTADSTDKTTTYNTKKDQSDYNSTDTLSFTNRQDSTAYGKSDTRTDNLHEKEVIEHKRGGNIGVTMTTQLFRDSMDFSQHFKLIEMIAADIANAISYPYDIDSGHMFR